MRNYNLLLLIPLPLPVLIPIPLLIPIPIPTYPVCKEACGEALRRLIVKKKRFGFGGKSII